MKILYVLNSGEPGGMEKHVVELTKGMSEKGHEVFVWCPQGMIQFQLDKAGATVYTERIRIDIDPFYISKLLKFLRLKKIDVIHAHELKAVINGMIAASIVGTEVKVSHTHTPITEWRIGPIKKTINIILDSVVINISGSTEIALTESRKKVKIKEGIRDKNLVVIPNALNMAAISITKEQKNHFNEEIRKRYNISPDAHIIGNVSRMTKEKGHTLLIESFSKVSFHNEKLHLLLAGGGVLEDEIKDLVVKLNLVDKVTITGRFPDEDLVKLYATFDTFVFPTLAEGFGYVLVEAMYSEIPVLCSDLEVLKEVGGDTITYFETNNLASLTKHLSDILKNHKKYSERAKGAKKRIEEKYSMDQFIMSYNDLYKDLYSKYQKEQDSK